MEAKKFEQSRDTACSFKTMLHPRYEAIKAECDPWILALAQPTSPTAAGFWVDCLFPLLCCLCYPHCLAERVVKLSKFINWFLVADDEDDDPTLLGAESMMNGSELMSLRHNLILECIHVPVEDRPPHQSSLQSSHVDHTNADHALSITSVKMLREAWRDMCKDMPRRLQARFYDDTRDYLNGVTLQMHYRSTRSVPTLEEYIALRRPSSLAAICFMLLEYGLGIELDEETLQDASMQQLISKSMDHVALTNDLYSCNVELHKGDEFNLPAIIYRNSGSMCSFADAMRSARRMQVQEVDEQCVRLAEEVRKSELMRKKPELEGFVYGLGTWIAGSRDWSLVTARYTHACSSGQGLVEAVDKFSSP